jgi:hypothetical protein
VFFQAQQGNFEPAGQIEGAMTSSAALGAALNYGVLRWGGIDSQALNIPRGAGGSTTSPWLSDPRAGVSYLIEDFRNGDSFLVTESTYEKYMLGEPVVGRLDGQFMTTGKAMDGLLRAANGDLNYIKAKLGISPEEWNEPLVRIDAPSPLLYNARLPSGFEEGANSPFKWGGFTSGGMPEIVTDPIPSSRVSAKFISLKKP